MLHDPEGNVVEVHAVHAGAVVDEGEDEVEEDGDDDGEPVEEGLEGRTIVDRSNRFRSLSFQRSIIKMKGIDGKVGHF